MYNFYLYIYKLLWSFSFNFVHLLCDYYMGTILFLMIPVELVLSIMKPVLSNFSCLFYYHVLSYN